MMNSSQPLIRDVPLSDELAGVFARMSGLLLSEETVETALGVLSALAQETVPGSSGAGVSIIDSRRRRSSGATDSRVEEADGLQYEFDEGPCLAAAETREFVRMDDLTEDRRWPRWTAAALDLGLRSAMSAPLIAGDTSLGAIKVYAEEPAAFDAHSEHVLTLFSAQATVLVANVQHHERAKRLSSGMREAFRSRDLVSIAKGVLMGRNTVDEDTAFGMLLARCQQEGTSVAEAAQAVVDSAVRRRR
jgi:GAF domain-containing protein